MSIVRRNLAIGFVLLSCSLAPVPAQEAALAPGWVSEAVAAAAPVLHARSAILVDVRTGTVLCEKRADWIIPPASLTKIMTIHLALKAQAEGRLSLEERFVPGPESWAANMPPRSSLMFLGPGQNVSVREILRGLAVSSGNDAAVALAHRMAGSVPAFAEMMNREAVAQGLPELYFVEPAGLSGNNRITARAFAEFSRRYIARWPSALPELHAVREFTYPTESNYEGPMQGGSITQANRNRLLWDYPEVDGLKTGYIRQSGFNLALTARREDFRLVAVILGVPGENVREGQERFAADGRALLDYGFAAFAPAAAPRLELPPVRVYGGRARTLTAAADPPLPDMVIIERGAPGEVGAEVRIAAWLEAPVAPGERVGEVAYLSGGRVIKTVELLAAREVPPGGALRRAAGRLLVLMRRLFRGQSPGQLVRLEVPPL